MILVFSVITSDPNWQPLKNMVCSSSPSWYTVLSTTQPNHHLQSCQVKSAVGLTKQGSGELSEQRALNKHSNTHIQKGCAATQPSLRCPCTVRDNEGDKTHHINYPANTFFQGPVKHCAEAFLRTYAIPVGIPRHSWVLNLGSLKIACQQQGLRGGEGEWVSEERGETRLALEVNNEVSAEAVSRSVMTVTDFHLGGISRKRERRGTEIGMRKMQKFCWECEGAHPNTFGLYLPPRIRKHVWTQTNIHTQRQTRHRTKRIRKSLTEKVANNVRQDAGRS